MPQLLLLPDPRPLDQRLGRDFFLEAPRSPGVYLMRDASDRILYVGKAKNLRQRLNYYRLANPDRMALRHLRLVRDVARIELQLCETEAAALQSEALLLRTLRPKFNRAGTWPGKARFLIWQTTGETLHLRVVETPGPDWRRFGPLGSSAIHLHQILSRLFWLAVNAERAISEMPAGWMHGEFMGVTTITASAEIPALITALEALFWSENEFIPAWLESKLAIRTHPFERSVLAADLEALGDFARQFARRKGCKRQLWLL